MTKQEFRSLRWQQRAARTHRLHQSRNSPSRRTSKSQSLGVGMWLKGGRVVSEVGLETYFGRKS